ncbi:MAG: DEAD/DEAH box helicase [Aestuariibacter sp.]
MQFSDFPLDHRILKTLAVHQFETPTPVQVNAIPPAITGKDLLACSKTGSGKTLAYLIPAIHNVLKNKALSKRDPRVLIVSPTRELAKQVWIELRNLLPNRTEKPVLLVGGENFNDQVKLLKRDPDFIVGTPGRIADHVEDKSLFLQGLEMLILDEADRILDLGFRTQLDIINQAANHRKRQTLFFSATLDNNDVLQSASQLLNSPVKFMLDDFSKLHEDIDQAFLYADDVQHKERLLLALLNEIGKREQAIVFTATRDDTERLAVLLHESGISSIALHGDMLQSQRNQTMQAFGVNKHACLVTTDVASRGLDIPTVKWVINFDLPIKATEYIHRIGRTGRAGETGFGRSFVSKKDWNSFIALRQLINDEPKFIEIDKLQAKFKGFAFNKSKGVAHSDTQKKSKHTKPQAKTKKKKFDALQGQDIGHAPIKKKPRQIDLKDDDEDSSST